MSKFKDAICICDAISEIRSNRYLLPAFQREFTWSHTQIERLFDSLMKGYPVGSLLLWKVSGEVSGRYRFYRLLQDFRERHRTHNEEFHTTKKDVFFAILDGQQRLTSLYIGLCGSFAYHRHYARYDDTEWNFPTRHLYLNLSRKVREDDNEESYGFSFIDKAVTTDVLYTDDNGDRWFRVGHVLDFSDEYDVQDFIEDYSLSRDERKILSRLDILVKKEEVISYYEEDTESPDKAVTIFVRINSGGTRLSFADILLSITVASWQKDAREEIQRLVDSVNTMGFWISHEFVLKSFLFLEHTDVRFRIGSFDNGFIERIEERWPEIRDAIIELFTLLRSFGLDHGRLAAYYATLPILHRIYHGGLKRRLASSSSFFLEREDIRRWLLRTLLMKSFTFGTDGKLQKVRQAMAGSNVFPSLLIDKAVRQPSDVTDEFLDELLATQSENRYAFIILSLLYPHLDYSGTDYHIDHIHPYIECENAGLDKSVYNSILNLQMLSASENLEKGFMPLEEWVRKHEEEGGAFFNKHLIPNTLLDIGHFDDFIRQRKGLLMNQLRAILT